MSKVTKVSNVYKPNKSGMRLPDTPKPITTIGGAYGTLLTPGSKLAKMYGIGAKKGK